EERKADRPAPDTREDRGGHQQGPEATGTPRGAEDRGSGSSTTLKSLPVLSGAKVSAAYAASRTFCTAGSKRPVNTALIAITTRPPSTCSPSSLVSSRSSFVSCTLIVGSISDPARTRSVTGARMWPTFSYAAVPLVTFLARRRRWPADRQRL